MSQTLTTKLPDEIYQVLQRLAPDMGMTVEELAMEWIARYAKKPRPQFTDEARRGAWEHLQRHMGAENLGYATGVDNERIDADLAKGYADTHNGET
ncbi:hypothetical protein IH992_29410 [Candidatus Poribacteria bacterium]|nr:hypothetical protein [Candidatus Poribacteria bacterium]